MEIKHVDPKTAKKWLDAEKAILIDVREPAEHRVQKIHGAELRPSGSVCCAALPKTDKKVIVHCQKGGRASNACQKLMAENSGADIYNLEGGILGWAAAGLPTESGGKKILPLDRQVQIAIGSCVLIFSLLGYFTNPAFSLAAAFFGAGLLNAGITGWCGLGLLIAKMPWNR